MHMFNNWPFSVPVNAGPLVLAAGARAGFLAVGGLWSCCRCKGLCYPGQVQSGEENVKYSLCKNNIL